MRKAGFARSILLVAVLAATGTCLTGQSRQQINWLTWEEVLDLEAQEPRKIVVDVYTDWCGWCKKMDKATFAHPDVINYINKHYYAVKFNAEDRNEIRINDRTYKFVRQGARGYHEFAAKITYGKLSFPTIVFLDSDLNVIQPIPGYKDHEIFGKIMTYFAEDYHKTMPWKRFIASYENN